MSPEPGFYQNPSRETLSRARNWDASAGAYYPAELTSANGHTLFALINPDPRYIDGGDLIIPFGQWTPNLRNKSDERLLSRAREFEAFDLIGGIESDYNRLEALGLTERVVGGFRVNISRSVLQNIEFRKHGSFSSMAIWPIGGIRVEGFVEDFMKSFPGWQVKPTTF